MTPSQYAPRTAEPSQNMALSAQPVHRILQWGHAYPRLLLSVLSLILLAAGWWLARQPDGAAATGLRLEHLLYLGLYLAGGFFPVADLLPQLRRREFDIDILMVLAAAGAALLNTYLEGGLLLFLFTLSGALEQLAQNRMRHAIEQLKAYEVLGATVLADGREIRMDIEDVMPGDVVIVRPGQRIPVDGIVCQGTSHIDQSMITGESMPVRRTLGDDVYGGTLNGQDTLHVETRHTARESQLQKIIQLIAEAQESEAPRQRRITAFTRIYVPGVLALSGLTFGLGLMLAGREPDMAWDRAFPSAFLRAITVLVAASPCALAISVPTSFLSAIGVAARHKVLIKGGEFVERLARVHAIVFDKTGTLTRGRPTVMRVQPLPGHAELELLCAAGVAEQHSDHPVASAMMAHIKARGIVLPPPTASRVIEGFGVEAHYREDGVETRVAVGNMRFCRQHRALSPAVQDIGMAMEEEGMTAAVVMRQTPARPESDTDTAWEVLGCFGVVDPVRPEAGQVICELRRIGIDNLHMLTGDNTRVARRIARELQLEHVHAELLPSQKVDILRTLDQAGQGVAMLGDGINDAPALATASVGIAMGTGSADVTLETADVVLLSDNLERLPFLIRLSRWAERILLQNLVFAVGTMLLMLVFIYTGWFTGSDRELPLAAAVVGHEGSTVVVVFNSLRLLTFRPGT